jgi:hypothetical protein
VILLTSARRLTDSVKGNSRPHRPRRGCQRTPRPQRSRTWSEDAMFPNTASPATAATIAAMMDDEDLSAANARRLAHDARVAQGATAGRVEPVQGRYHLDVIACDCRWPVPCSAEPDGPRRQDRPHNSTFRRLQTRERNANVHCEFGWRPLELRPTERPLGRPRVPRAARVLGRRPPRRRRSRLTGPGPAPADVRSGLPGAERGCQGGVAGGRRGGPRAGELAGVVAVVGVYAAGGDA